MIALLMVSPVVISLLVLSDSGTRIDSTEKSSVLTISGGALYTSANGTTPAYVNQTVSFWVRASSDVSSTLTFTMYYDYYLPNSVINPASPISVNTTGSPGAIITTFAYDHIGNLTGTQGTYFHVRCIVADGVSSSLTLNRFAYVVAPPENRAPQFSYELPSSIDVTRGVPMSLSTEIADPDDDSVNVTWEWGDGSPNGTNATGPAAAGVWANQTHTWDPYIEPGTGDYTLTTQLNITLDDGQGHVVMSQYQIRIYVPYNYAPTLGLKAPVASEINLAVNFTANATDPDGDPLTWTFDFGDGSLEVYHTAGIRDAVVWNNVSHVYTVVENYTIYMHVSDALGANQVFPHNVSELVKVRVFENQPPFVTGEITVSDENPLINETTGNVTVVFKVQASDTDGDPLTLVWDFKDGSPTATNESTATGTQDFIQEHGYTVPGQYNVTVNVTDGRGHWAIGYKIINVSSDNRPLEFGPSNISYPAGRGDYALPNETVNITFSVMDPEQDVLTFVIDFGDGSPLLNLTLSDYDVDGNLTFTVSHSYSSVGVYIVKVNATDNKIGKGEHAVNYSLNIKIDNERVIVSNAWDIWDYVGISLFLMIPILVVIWLASSRRHQRALDDAGITYDQYMARKQEIKQELKARKG